MQHSPQTSKLSSVLEGRGKTGWVLFLFVLLVVGSLTLLGWQDVVSGLSRLSPAKILLLCALAAAHYVIRAFRWHLIVRAGGVSTTVGRNALHFFGGFAMTATPGRLGEFVRLRWLRRDSGKSLGELLPIVFADRAIELASMVLLIALSLLLVNLGTNAAWWLLGVAVFVVWVACRPRVLEYFVTSAWVVIGKRLPRLFVRLRRLTRRLTPFMRMSLLLPTVSIGIIGWAFEGVAFYILLIWLDASLEVWTALAIFLVAVLSGALSGLPGGLGGTEASAVALLLIQGIPLETAILSTIIIRVTTLWFAVFIGLVVFPFAEARSGKLPSKQKGRIL